MAGIIESTTGIEIFLYQFPGDASGSKFGMTNIMLIKPAIKIDAGTNIILIQLFRINDVTICHKLKTPAAS